MHDCNRSASLICLKTELFVNATKKMDHFNTDVPCVLMAVTNRLG